LILHSSAVCRSFYIPSTTHCALAPFFDSLFPQSRTFLMPVTATILMFALIAARVRAEHLRGLVRDKVLATPSAYFCPPTLRKQEVHRFLKSDGAHIFEFAASPLRQHTGSTGTVDAFVFPRQGHPAIPESLVWQSGVGKTARRINGVASFES
jgi:hypothetical protein